MTATEERLLERIDETAEVFEESILAGGQPSIPDLLTAWPDHEHGPLLRTLLDLEIDYLLRRGEVVTRDEYQAVFPKHAGEVDEAFDTHGELCGNVLGQYAVLGRIGQGGMGTVYRALHLQLRRVVALKVLRKHAVEDKEMNARFDREIRACGSMEHPNIASATDAWEHNGVRYLAMHFVDGIALSDFVRVSECVEVRDACAMICQVAEGLSYAHTHGLTHRDIKPSNIMLDRNGCIRILDFGLARFADGAVDEITLTGQVMGTLDYIAPEQADAAIDADHRADIYCLGGTLFALLAGRAPLGGPEYVNASSKLLAVTTGKTPTVATIRPDLPKPLTQIVDRMMAFSPCQRFSTAQEVADALREWATGAELRELAQQKTERCSSPQSAPVKSPLALKSTHTVAGDGTQLLPDSLSHATETVSAADSSNTSILTGRKGSRIWKRVAAGMLFALSALTIHQTDGGRIEVRCDDDTVPFELVRVDGESTETVFAGSRQETFFFRSGEWELRIPRDRQDDFECGNGTLTIRRFGKVVFDIVRKPPPTTTKTAEQNLKVGVSVGSVPNVRSTQIYSEWQKPERLEIPELEGFIVGRPTISADGSVMVVESDRVGGHGALDLWMVHCDLSTGECTDVTNLGEGINTAASESDPCLSADGLMLVHCSRRLGGAGKSDIWISLRANTATSFGDPQNAGPLVNSEKDETGPCLSSDSRTLYFASKRHGGFGRIDIWKSEWAESDNQFGQPTNLGPRINSVSDDRSPFVSSSGLEFWFSSNRAGGRGARDLWVSRRNDINSGFAEPQHPGENIASPYQEESTSMTADGLVMVFESNQPTPQRPQTQEAVWISRRITRNMAD